MKIAVYLGSNHSKKEAFEKATEDLGRWIGRNGHTLVYGGSCLGMMNTLAEAVRAENGKVTGVMPEFMIARGRQHTGLDELIRTEDLSARKKKMMKLADAYVAMPGGPGTLEEIAEAISASRLSLHAKPCILANLDGYYEPLKQQFEAMKENGFLETELSNVYFAQSVEEITEILNRYK